MTESTTDSTSATPASDLAASDKSDTVVDINVADTADTANADDAKTAEPAAPTDTKGEEITVGEAKFSVDPAVARHIAELASRAAPAAPEDYQLTVPDEIKDQITPDAEDPRWLALQTVAREHNLSQETVSAILASHYQAEADGAANASQFHDEQRAEMIKAFNNDGALSDEAAAKAAQGVADWAVSLLKGDIANNPALADELAVTAQTAAGVQLLAAIRSRVGEGHVPASRDVADNQPNPWKTGDGFNLTKQGEVYRQNPELAKTLEQQAKAA